VFLTSTIAAGSIVLMSSAITQKGVANHEAIAAAKAGVNGLVLSAAATYAPGLVRVNAVAPGEVHSLYFTTLPQCDA
jgi:NAD(P)-dependent dehydrogenase (short-subunit alcohol dehydrogenase family)